MVLTHVEAITSGATSTVDITRVGMFATTSERNIKGLFPGFFLYTRYVLFLDLQISKSAPPFLAKITL